MYNCESCDISFENIKYYISHVKITHSDANQFHCGNTSCLRNFKSINSLINHIKAKHSGTETRPPKKNRKVNVVKRHIENEKKTSLNDSVNEDNIFEPNIDDTLDNEINLYPPTENTYNGISFNEWNYFATKIYHYPDVCRVRALKIVNDAGNLSKDALNHTFSSLSNYFSSDACDMNEESKRKVLEYLKNSIENYSNQIDNFKTEHNIFKFFETERTFIKPTSYLLGERQDFRKFNEKTTLEMIPVTAQFIELRRVLKNFFELPSIFEETFQYIESLKNSTIISNFIQGDLWKSLSLNDDDKTVYPLFLYFDDYENNNPLGSHKGISKCGAFYISIPCLPPKLQAKRENISLFVLFNTLDRKFAKNEVIFSKIKDELEFLEKTGITINLPNGPKQLYFRLSLLIVDNLGIRYLLGFSESFNQKKFCQLCEIKKPNINCVLKESQSILRTETSYELDF